jgi:hypothetical protein
VEDWTGLGFTAEEVRERVNALHPRLASAEASARELEEAGFTVLETVLPMAGLAVVTYASVYHPVTMRALGRIKWRTSPGRATSR